MGPVSAQQLGSPGVVADAVEVVAAAAGNGRVLRCRWEVARRERVAAAAKMEWSRRSNVGGDGGGVDWGVAAGVASGEEEQAGGERRDVEDNAHGAGPSMKGLGLQAGVLVGRPC